MLFEDLCLRPASGVVDIAALAAWLDARPHVYRDARADVWHLCATPRAVVHRRAWRQRPDATIYVGVQVSAWADRVGIAALADRDDLARARELVQWLVRDGDWTAAIDGGPAEPVGDPRRLFPADLPDPATLVDDPTYEPVLDGTRLDWWWVRGDALGSLVVHSSGAWRLKAGAHETRGQLDDAARATLVTAIASLDPDDPDLPEVPDERRIFLEIQTSLDCDQLELDPVDPPPAYRRLVTLLESLVPAGAR